MRTIGRYHICGLLGRGGMGKVYRVVLPAVGKMAALKLLSPDPLVVKLMGMADLRRMFTREAQTMAALQHPHIVGVHDFDEDKGHLFYTMDYHANNLGIMIGESFRTEQASRLIAADTALAYTRQTLNGLARLHDAGIIHRDIKPYNLLITDWDTVKICDFGLSKLRGETYSGPANLNVGSPFYAAPEQERAPDDADQRADLYPVGVMLYRMLTGNLPPETNHRANPRPPSSIRPELDTHWDGFLSRALAPIPEDRFRDTADMLQALDTLASHWQKQKGRICTLPVPDAHPRWSPEPGKGLRRHPEKMTPAKALTELDLDKLWRPKRYVANDFHLRPRGVVHDRATGLVWQQGGSTFPLNWRQARDYIDTLNRDGFAGRTTWRLPTIAELISLLRPAGTPGDLCIEPVFAYVQRRVWSCDKRSFTAAYYADIDLGFVGWHDMNAFCHSRAVSTQ